MSFFEILQTLPWMSRPLVVRSVSLDNNRPMTILSVNKVHEELEQLFFTNEQLDRLVVIEASDTDETSYTGLCYLLKKGESLDEIAHLIDFYIHETTLDAYHAMHQV